MLLCNYIALWDIIGSANRDHSSLDSKIKNVKVNDIETLLMDYDNIQLILLNGGKASKEYQKHFKHLNIRALPMPSTSPAYARMGFDELYKSEAFEHFKELEDKSVVRKYL